MPFKNPDERRAYQRKWMADRRDAWFVDKECVDCGSTEKLELDHVDPEAKVTHRIWNWAFERRKEELEKCVARCESCHAKRSAEQSRVLLSKPITHGLITSYIGRGCRCELCSAKHKEWRRRQYLQYGR